MTNLSPSREEAATELLRRRNARQSLIGFTEYTYPSYEPSEHHIVLAEKLEAAGVVGGQPGGNVRTGRRR